jgi:hypothetical protein
MTNRIQMLSIAAIAAAITILASSTITTPALATSSKHEFRHDVRQFLVINDKVNVSQITILQYDIRTND